MNNEQLQYLHAIKKYGNMSKASKMLFLTPQSLSKSVKTLENELGFKILYTSNKGVTFSELGEKLLDISSDFLSSIEALKQTAAATVTTTNISIHIYALSSFEELYFNRFFKNNLSKPQPLDIILHELDAQKLIAKIKAGEIEYGFYHRFYLDGKDISEPLDAGLAFEPIFLIQHICACSTSSPLSKHRRISIKSMVSKHPFLLHIPSQFLFLNLFNALSLMPETIPLPNVDTIVEAIYHNKGVCFFQQVLQTGEDLINYDHNKIALINLKETIIGNLGYLHRQDGTLSYQAQNEIAYLSSLL